MLGEDWEDFSCAAIMEDVEEEIMEPKFRVWLLMPCK